MKIICETTRLILRQFELYDAPAMQQLDADPEVMHFLGGSLDQSISDCEGIISRIHREYTTHGVGRLAVAIKDTNEFLGWAGLKFIPDLTNNQRNYYDVGYRFSKDTWGKGYASEAALATISYGLDDLKLEKLVGVARHDHPVSQHILQKCGLQYINKFMYYDHSHFWYEINKNL